MTKKERKKERKATVQAKAPKLNIKRMTLEYFYPDVISGTLQERTIPTAEELGFLSKGDVEDIQQYLRREEKKLKKNLLRLSEEIASLLKLRKSQTLNGEYCDWHGLGYIDVPSEIVAEIADNGTNDMLSTLRTNRSKKVFTCRYGRFVAQWCYRTPQSCTGNGCTEYSADIVPLLMIGAKIVEQKPETTKVLEDMAKEIRDPTKAASLKIERAAVSKPSVKRCAHYDKCHGYMPMQGEKCILAETDSVLWRDCADYLNRTSTDFRERLDFVSKYLHNLTEAMKGNLDTDKPYTGLVKYYDLGDFGTAIVELSRDKNGDVVSRCGVHRSGRFDRVNTPVSHVVALLDSYETTAEKQSSGSKDTNLRPLEPEIVELTRIEQPTGRLFFRAIDLLYLIQHPDYREVWLNLVGGNVLVEYEAQMMRDFFNQVCEL